MKSILRNEKGLTLLEVLAASVLLVVVALLLYTFSSSMSLSGHKSDRSNEAMGIAETVLNHLRNETYATRTGKIAELQTLYAAGDYQVSITKQSVSAASSPGPSPQTYNFASSESNQRVSVSGIMNIDSVSQYYVVVVTVSWG